MLGSAFEAALQTSDATGQPIFAADRIEGPEGSGLAVGVGA